MMVAKGFKNLFSSIFDFVPVKVHWLFWANLALIAGIWWHTSHSLSLLISIEFIFLLVCWLRSSKLALLLTCCFFFGYFRPYIINQNYLYQKTKIENTFLAGTAKIVAIEPTQNKYYQYRLTLKLVSGENSIIQIYMPKKVNAAIGDTIFLNNLLVKKNSNSDYTRYLVKEGILATVFVQALEYRLISHPDYSLSRTINSMRENLKNSLQKKMSKSTAALFFSIFLGLNSTRSTDVSLQIKEQLGYWGTVHYLARSGLHLVLIIIFLSVFLRCVPCHFLLKQFVILFFTIVYALLTWSSISFARSLLTFIIYQSCIAKDLPINSLHVITVVCFVTLMYNPFHLFFLDFQLSFACTFALAWLNELKLLNTVSRLN